MRDVENIKAWLQKNKGHWSYIAKEAGISARTIYNIMNAETPTVTTRILRKLMEVKKEWK